MDQVVVADTSLSGDFGIGVLVERRRLEVIVRADTIIGLARVRCATADETARFVRTDPEVAALGTAKTQVGNGFVVVHVETRLRMEYEGCGVEAAFSYGRRETI